MALLRKRGQFISYFVFFLLIKQPISTASLSYECESFGLPVCSCNGSFVNISCIPHDAHMKIIYATEHEIISIEAHGKKSNLLKTDPNGSPRFLTTDVRNNIVFWSDYEDYQEAVYKTVLSSELDQNATILVDSNVYTPAGVAFDWITENLYIADSNLSFIAVCAQNPTKCVVIYRETLSRPLDIALHPNEGIMFWTDIGPNAGIRKSAMDGSAFETIIAATNTSLPHGLSVDEPSSRIYWSQIDTGTIHSSKFDGSDRRIIKTLVDAYDVEVLGEWIFWSDSATRKIMRADKLTGANDTEVIPEYISKTMNGFTIIHMDRQPIRRIDPCTELQCSDICVLVNSTEAICLCATGTLKNLTHCYADDTEPHLLLAHENKLLRMNSIGVGDSNSVFDDIQMPTQITAINAIVANPINLTLIISDATLKQIIEFKPTILGPRNYSVLVDGIVNVTHIAIDVVSENIIWFDQGKRTLEMMSLRTRRKTELLRENVEDINDICFATDHMALYISKTGGNDKENIERVTLGSRTRKAEFPPIQNSFNSAQLSYEPSNKELIYAISNGSDVTINSLSIDSSTLFDLGSYPGSLATDLVAMKNKIFWVDDSANLRVLTSNGEEWYEHNIKISDKSTKTFCGRKLLTLLDPNTDAFEHQRNYHDCSPVNPNGKRCEHICVSVGIGMLGECICSIGFELRSDQLSCVKSKVEHTQTKDKKTTVSNGFWVFLTVVCVSVGSILAYLVAYWWKTRTIPEFIAAPYARFTQK